MPSSSPRKRAPAPRWLLLLTLALSVLAHWGVAGLAGNLRLPDLEIELEIPLDVELGLSEEVEAAPVAPPEPVAEPTVAKLPKAKHPADLADAGAPDAQLADASEPRDGSPENATSDAGPRIVGDAGPPGARLPPGAQIALRIDMTRIRQSPVVGDVRALLAAVPDWKALLDGSGIDPVTQLDRLLIATPNLQRENVYLAGRYVGGKQVVLDAVHSLAQARGVEASWRSARGLPIAPWANADTTPRVIALIGPSHFTISREEDLERVLTLAAARGRPQKGAAQQSSTADGLLSMEEQEGLSLEVDGVARFVRRAKRGIPSKLRLSAIERGGTQVEIRGRLSYEDLAATVDALDFWKRARDSYARNTLISLLGLSSVLSDGVIEQHDQELHVKLVLSVQQTRLILGYARELLGAKPPVGPTAPGTPATP